MIGRTDNYLDKHSTVINFASLDGYSLFTLSINLHIGTFDIFLLLWNVWIFVAFYEHLLSYNINDLANENKYLVTAAISVCFETWSPCEHVIQLLKDSMIPKPPCDYQLDFFIAGKYPFEVFSRHVISRITLHPTERL